MESSSLSDYMIGDSIGQGSFGTVYYGIHKDTSRDVAIKLYDKTSLQKHPAWLQAVLTEQRILRKIADFPFVVTLLASFHDDQFVYLVLEFFGNGTLTQYLQQKRTVHEPVWDRRAAQIALGIHAAVQTLHTTYKVIHADLKPDNLLLTDDWRRMIVLTDFGSAVSTDEDAPTTNASLRGTAEYAAPELVRGNCIPTTAVDWWSFGCLLCALWTGASPFHADSEALILDKVVGYANGDIACANLGARVPPTILNLIQQLLDPIPQNRTCCSLDGIQSVLRLESTTKDDDEFFKNEPRRRSLESDDVALSDPIIVWSHETKKCEMKDGILGWRVFL